MKRKPYSVCIGIEKLKQLKKGRSTIVSHRCSPRWENIYVKKPKNIRFYDQNLLDVGIFKIKTIKKEQSLREIIITIEITKQILI